MNSTNQSTSSDEIDIVELFLKAVKGIKNNSVLIISTLLIGIGLGWTYYQFSTKIYESKMLILAEPYTETIIINIDKLIGESNAQVLSEKLNLPADQVTKIVGIKIIEKLEKPSEIPEEEDKTYFTLSVEMRDNSFWSQVQEGLMFYFKNNEFINIKTEQKKKYINQIVERINTELIDLEKLKENITEGGLVQANKQSIVLFDPTTISTKILALNKEKINLQNSLESINGVQIVEGFTVYKNPSKPKFSLSLAAGALFGIFIASMVILFKALRLIISEPTV